MPSYKLHYFDVRGLGEAARLLFHASGTKFEDVRFTQEEWPKIKPNAPTGKAPWLEVDGHVIPESFVIFRFLGARFGFAGKDEFERAEVDSAAEFYRDSIKDAFEYLMILAGRKEGDKDKAYTEKFLPAIKNTLPYVEKVIKKSGSGFIAPSGVTWADFALAENLYNIRKYAPEAFKDYKFVDEYITRVHSVPKVKEYIASRKETIF